MLNNRKYFATMGKKPAEKLLANDNNSVFIRYVKDTRRVLSIFPFAIYIALLIFFLNFVALNISHAVPSVGVF